VKQPESIETESQQIVDSVKKPNGAPKFTISILTCNFTNEHKKVTVKCLESVMKHSGDSFEVYITDNASSKEGNLAYLKEFQQRFSDRVTLIQNHDNEGFQKPNEHVLTLARGEFFVLLNNDMEACAGWLDSLAQPFSDNPMMGITGGGAAFTRLTAGYQATTGEPVEYIEGSCLMIPTALARKHGLFAKYLKFIYWEDTDLSFRMRELGYEIKSIKIPMKHRHPSTTTKLMDLTEVKQHNYEAFKSRWNFYIKRRNFERRVLIRRLGARGDVLLLTPAIRALLTKWPQAEIQVITKCPEMLSGMPGVKMATQGTKYFDHVYDLDLSYEARPNVHIVQAYADALEVALPSKWQIEMFPTAEERAWGFRKSRGMKVALIHAGVTTWPGKNWPLDRMNEVVRQLKALGYFTIAVGAADSPRAGCDDTVAGQGTPQALYALARHSSLFVGLDSMPQHVASAANVPSVVMFGPTNPKMIVRPTPRIKAVQGDVTMVPCVGEHGRRTKAITQAPCAGDCAKAVTVEMMMRAVRGLIAMGI
jgi:ADP-heptose:LPS heptosyltransferase/GT2 family glycosyltransferase